MEFYRYTDSWMQLKTSNVSGQFSDREHWWRFQQALAEEVGNPFNYRLVELERGWRKLGSPYYNVYPAILPMLTRLKLNIACSSLHSLRVQPLEVRLPVNLEESSQLAWEHGQVQTILFGIQKMPSITRSGALDDGVCIMFDVGERCQGEPVYSFRMFPLVDDMLIEDALTAYQPDNSIERGLRVPQHVADAVVKLCACIALIDEDADMLTPDVLARHAPLYLMSTPERQKEMVEMAHRRGKTGWNLGAAIETIPHYRRPHPAIVRTGKGRVSQKIVMRKGSVVNRTKLTRVPTDYDAGGEDE